MPLLSGVSLSKSFGGVHALDSVDIHLFAGEVHVLAGENGSGKSTLLKILSGALPPDQGEVILNGRKVILPDIRSAMRLGVTRISQELSLAPDLSVAENIFMGHGKGPLNTINRKVWEEDSSEILHGLGADIDPKKMVRDLMPDQSQLVEISRALSLSSRIMLLDEPTSSLDTQESEFLFQTMRNLAQSGVAVVFISHRMAEMLAVGDRFTVLRDGKLVATSLRSEIDHDWLINNMVGREISIRRFTDFPNQKNNAPCLEVKDLRDASGKIKAANFTVNPGEIVGLAGLVGAGKTELLELIAGVRERGSGSVSVDGREIAGGVGKAISAGIGFVPEDRKKQGIVSNMTVRDNVMIGRPSGVRPIEKRKERKTFQKWSLSLNIKGSATMPLRALSGGNQQKTVIARVLKLSPRVLLLDEPTRGVDIGAKSEIYEIISTLASTGITIIVASSELPEILAVSTRVLVMNSGMIAADLPFEGLTEGKIISIATGMM